MAPHALDPSNVCGEDTKSKIEVLDIKGRVVIPGRHEMLVLAILMVWEMGLGFPHECEKWRKHGGIKGGRPG